MPRNKCVVVRNAGNLTAHRNRFGSPAPAACSCCLARQAATAYVNDRNAADQYGNLWPGPRSSTAQSGPDQPAAAQQGSAVYLQNAGPGFTSPNSPAVTNALNCS